MEVQIAKKNRIEYFDFLRVLATFSVVLLHVSTQYWTNWEVHTTQWQIVNFYSSISHWPVPVFFMISGTLFIGSKRQIQDILKKNILRLVAALVFWSVLYAANRYFDSFVSWKEAVYAAVFGHYHLWFVFVLIGLYFTVPIFQKIAESEQVTKYFLLVSFFVGGLFPMISRCLGLLSTDLEYYSSQLLNQYEMFAFSNHAFYFLLGFYLHNTILPEKWTKRMFLWGILSALATILLTAVISLWKHEPVLIFYENTSVNISCMGIAIFVLGKKYFHYQNHSNSVILLVQKMSKYSFGIYLVHLIALDILNKLFACYDFHLPLFMHIPVVSLAVYVFSYVITAIIHKIPVLNRFIV